MKFSINAIRIGALLFSVIFFITNLQNAIAVGGDQDDVDHRQHQMMGKGDAESVDLEEKVHNLNDLLENLSVPANAANDYELIVLNKLLEKAADLISKSSAVAGGIVTLLTLAVPKPDSKEMKAIKELNKNMVREFEHSERKISNLIEKVNCEKTMYDYSETVLAPLDELETVFKQMIDPEQLIRSEKIYYKRFTTICDHHNQTLASTVFHILDYIRRYMVTNCPWPKGPMELKAEGKKICQIESSASSSESGHIKEMSGSPCFPEIVLRGNEQRREPLVHFISTVTGSIIKALFFGSFCIKYGPDHTEADFKRLEDSALSTCLHMVKWFDRTMALAWPRTILEHLKMDTLGRGDVSTVDGQELDKIAKDIAKSAAQRGPLRFGYQVHFWVIPKNNGMLHWEVYNAKCELANDCVSAIINNIRVVLIRFPLNPDFYRTTKNALNWLKSEFTGADPEHVLSGNKGTNKDAITAFLQHFIRMDKTDQLAHAIDGIAQWTGFLAHFRTPILMSRTQHVYYALARPWNHYGWAQFVDERIAGQVPPQLGEFKESWTWADWAVDGLRITKDFVLIV